MAVVIGPEDAGSQAGLQWEAGCSLMNRIHARQGGDARSKALDRGVDAARARLASDSAYEDMMQPEPRVDSARGHTQMNTS